MTLTRLSASTPAQTVAHSKPNSTVAHASTKNKIIRVAAFAFLALVGLAFIGCMTAAIIQASVVLGLATAAIFITFLGSGGIIVSRPSNRHWITRNHHSGILSRRNPRVVVGSRYNEGMTPTRTYHERPPVIYAEQGVREVPSRSGVNRGVNRGVNVRAPQVDRREERPVVRPPVRGAPTANPGAAGRVLPGRRGV